MLRPTKVLAAGGETLGRASTIALYSAGSLMVAALGAWYLLQ